MERCRNNTLRRSSGGGGGGGYMREPAAARSFELSTHGNFLGGYPWPPKSYTCCFCKRELRSAQALGGHMNVHRRDRAKLRESSSSSSPSSWDIAVPPASSSSEPTSNPNPNNHHIIPDINPQESPAVVTIPDLNIVPLGSISDTAITTSPTSPLLPERFHKTQSTNTTAAPAGVRLDLEIGIQGDDHHLGDDLDLELRLGYA